MSFYIRGKPMELLNTNQLLEHLIRFFILMFGIGFAVVLGQYRPEWKSRKTIICWAWTMAAIDILIMDGQLARTLTAQLFIAGAILLNVINFIGDRIETIKFKDFSASLAREKAACEQIADNTGAWPDGDIPEQKPKRKK